MNRFKFRVWYNKHIEYVRQTGLYYGFMIDMEGSLCAFVDIQSEGSHDPVREVDSQFIIEQCTGLKDKNGNLIYESDIVLYGGTKYLVKWFDGCFVLAPIKSPCDMAGYRPFTELSVVPKLLEKEWEIIGNVHQEEQKDRGRLSVEICLTAIGKTV